ncbi:NEDD4-like E3 ubiquitin-protein ligase WWP1 [Phytophthora citrophthora]|uniref:HECT-type E3 ubiquitin transferase n=1 Tax=Phytophthora citrophthora TaxID=4793 RepID=A0AAD9G3L8_9STRA|nr:NEDD4-like E3 ubiquitin-protein ligase WWP1 [Phytophthora citrophthora]
MYMYVQEAAQPSKEEKLRFKVLKVIDARETLLYQLSALILCTPVQESLFLPSRPPGPPTSNTGGRQQMRSRGGMALASTPLSRHGGAGAMTNAREATKLAQQLATNLQVTGIQCVEALVEWMLEAGAQAEYALVISFYAHLLLTRVLVCLRRTPPPFLWRGRNYFLKMFGDLDFAEAELQARGVNLDCFSQHNPLLIKPNQKLGRVLAAHSVIMEMIEFAKDMTPMELLALSGRMRSSSREHSEPKIDSQTGFVAEVSADNNITHSMESDKSKIADSLALEHHGHDSAAELVNLLDESMDFIRGASREQDGDQAEATSDHEGEFDGNNNGESEEQADRPTTEDTAGADCPKEQFSLLETMELAESAARDNKSNEEDTGVGEYNDEEGQNVEDPVPESEIPLPEAPEAGASPEQVAVNNTPEVTLETEQDTVDIVNESGLGGEQHSSRSNGDKSGYENSFDADADAVDDEDDKKDEAIAEVHQLEKASDPEDNESSESNKTTAPEDSADDEVTDPPASENPATNRTEDTNSSEYDNSFDEEAEEGEGSNDVDTDNTVAAGIAPPILDLESVVDTESQGPVPETDDSQTVSKRLETELKRWAFLEDENHPTEVNVQGCLTWCSAREWKGDTQGNTLMREYIEGSIISMLDQYGLVVPETPLESFLSSEVALELDLASRLVDECQAVLGDICSVVAEAIQSSLGSRNSLVSEIEIEEVLETAEAVRQEYHGSTWEYLKAVTVLLLFVSTSHVEAFASIKVRSPVSSGLSRLVKVFYPYLVNQPREELSENWHSVSSLLVAMGLPVDRLYVLLDPVCKTLLLAVELSRRSNQDFQNEEDLTVYPKVTVVCDRDDVLQSSVDYVWRTHLSSETVPPIFSLFPFFKSSFGEKVVDGVKVEEGEGKGPLKEWFTLVGNQLMSKWKQIPLPQCMSESSTQITASGNAITVPGTSDIIKPGFQLEWETTGGEKIRRVVNKSVEDDTFLLDRTVPPHSFSTSQLSIWHPTTAIFEYVQGSESYWLNENTLESPETRNVLVFVGWFLASAVTHFSSIQVRIHPLLFRLLLDPQHCVKLEELQSFDLQLFQSLSRMKDMKASDFAEYLKFEGADESLSVGGYIDKVLEDKFGSASGIGWQLQALRRGFSRVIVLDQLSRVGIAELELVESVCGSSAGPGDDFVVNEVFRVAGDAEFTTCGPLMNAFWQTVNNFDPQLKRKFVKFVTGVDTLPLTGTEVCSWISLSLLLSYH